MIKSRRRALKLATMTNASAARVQARGVRTANPAASARKHYLYLANVARAMKVMILSLYFFCRCETFPCAPAAFTITSE